MAVAALALPRVQLFDPNGNPLAGGRLQTFAAGTTTPLASYKDALGQVSNTNPVICDAGGFCDVYLTTGVAYKLQVSSAQGQLLSTSDQVRVGTDPAAVATTDTVDGAAQTVSAMLATRDPGETGSEILATTLRQAIEQLRFRLGEITGENWNETYTTRKQVVLNGNYNVGTGWPDSVDLTYQWYMFIPAGFRTDLGATVKFYLSCTVATAPMVIQYQYFVIREGQPLFASGFAQANWAPVAANRPELRSYVIVQNTFLEGDAVLFQLRRLGTDLQDTNAGVVSFLGGWFEYTGVAGR